QWEKGRGGSIVPLCQSRPGQSVTWPCLPPTESRRCRPASERWISQVRNESTAWQPCHGHGQHAPSFPGHLVRSWDERLRNASAESRRPGRHPEECHQCPPTKTRPPPSDSIVLQAALLSQSRARLVPIAVPIRNARGQSIPSAGKRATPHS
ncbi:hypothetical protein GQ607_006725, partial [Colletotrichum asianum]